MTAAPSGSPPRRIGSGLLGLAALVLLCPVPGAAQNETCLICHGDPESFDAEAAGRLAVDGTAFGASIHGLLELECTACHVDLEGFEDFPHAEQLAPATCDGCHPDAVEAFETSVHGHARSRLLAAGVGDSSEAVPSCAGCHGAHDIQPSEEPASRTHRLRIAATCAACHGRQAPVGDGGLRRPRMVESYLASVHGRSNESGSTGAATCSDCHGAHDVRGPADPASRINRAHVAETCGACHGEAAELYRDSIHGRAAAAGVGESPTCTGCHGEHLILSPSGPEAATHASRLATETCGECHANPAIVAKYGLRSDVVASYVDSYHGWATRRASESAASCVSCHTAHDVRPASDPASTIHPDNVLSTCRSCHETADVGFAASYTHESVSITANPINRWIRNAYLGLIVVVIGGMLLHNLVIVGYYMRRRRRHLAESAALRRFHRAELIQHGTLALSFVALVVTGFALRFPEALWVQGLTALGMSEPVRAVLHRACGVVLVVLSLVHVAYVLAFRAGREQLAAMLPRGTDAGDAIGNLRFYAGRSERRPGFARYDYTQKVEYWAVVWGTALMAATGFVLWFPERAAALFPSWVIPASQTVHYYEAWLATLAIVVWHFFFVLFHPDAYPMSWTWLTGTMTEEEAREHHPRWFEEVRRRRGDTQGTAE